MNFYHKAISLAGFVLLTVLPAQAQVRQTREEYINKYKKIAVAHMERYGIPASITMAQGILESDCGNSWLSQASNNHFGIKCKRNWTGDVVYSTTMKRANVSAAILRSRRPIRIMPNFSTASRATTRSFPMLPTIIKAGPGG